MKLVVIIGSGAVGKMTVGQALMERTGLRLFHNHMIIEPVIDVFGCFNGKLIQNIRQQIFQEFVKTDLKGMIFTYMWAFDAQSDWDYITGVADLFEEKVVKAIRISENCCLLTEGMLEDFSASMAVDYAEIFDDIFTEYTASHELIKVKTTNMGSMFLLTYNISLKDPKKEKAMIDMLRTRNGNLDISISVQDTTTTTL